MNKIKSLNKLFYYKFFIPSVYSVLKIFIKPLSNNIVIDNKGENKIDESFLYLYEKLLEKDNINIYVYLNKKSFIDDVRFLREIAKSNIIFLSTYHTLIDCIHLKKSQKVINLWHGCGIFKKFGYTSEETAWGGKNINLRSKVYNLYKNTSIFTVSSPFCIPFYCSATNNNDNVVKSLGISRTDCFFDDKYLKSSKNKLAELLPVGVQNKKIILYAPTFRGENLESAIFPDFINFEKLSETLSNDYIVIIKHHPKIKKQQDIPAQYSNFIFNLTEKMNINEILPHVDILISDYSSLIFEFSLFEKPMIFFGPDIDQYNNDRGFFINYFDMIPGPLCRNDEELLECIKNIDSFDMTKIKDFKKKFMLSCDGKSTERLLNEIGL